MELTHRLNIVQPSMKSGSRTVTVDGSRHGGCAYEVSLAWRPWCLEKELKPQT